MEAPQIQISSVNVSPTKVFSVEALPKKMPLTSLARVKQGCGQPKKYPEHTNIAATSDICFLINKFDMFINKNADDKLVQYITSRQKEVARLFEKGVFKIVTINDISSNAQIFNSCFVNKIKNPNTDKAYKKSRLII